MSTRSLFSRWLASLWRALGWLALALGLGLGVGWALLHLWIVPRIDDFRPALERMATRTLGLPVHIGSVQAQSNGWAPLFELRDIRVVDAQGQSALSLPRVLLAISVRSALTQGVEQMVLDRPTLDVRQSASGAWLVAGLPWDGAGTPHDAAADWLFGQREVLVRGGTVRWTVQREATTHTLSDVDMVLRNALHHHALRLDATPPSDWGGRFVLMGQFQRGLLSTHPGRFQDWHGQAYAHFPQLDLAGLHQPVAALRAARDLQLMSGQGRVQWWADLANGQWQGGVLDAQLQQLRLRLRPDLAPLDFAHISGRVSGQSTGHQWSWRTQQLAFANAQGRHWPGGNVVVTYQQAHNQRPAQGDMAGQDLDLQLLHEMALRLPLSKDWRDPLVRRAVQGQLRTLHLQWAGPMDALTRYQGQAQVDQLHIQDLSAVGQRGPGLQAARVHTQFNQDGGQVQLTMGANSTISWPGLLEEDTLALRALQADVRWQLQARRLHSVRWQAQLANDDMQGHSHGQWQSQPDSRLGTLDLHAQVARAEASKIHRYLPVGLNADVRHYVRDSVRTGRVHDLNIRIQGDLDKLPMVHSQDGEFRFAGRLHEVDLAYVPATLQPAGSLPWPTLQGLQGDLVFERQGMTLANASARFGSDRQALAIAPLRADIADLRQDPQLRLQAEFKGPAQQVLHTLAQSPIHQMLSGALTQATASGQVHGKLNLTIPVLHAQDSKLQGHVVLPGNDVQMTPHTPFLDNTQGTIGFTESGFALHDVQTFLLGGTSRLEGGLRSGPVPEGEPPLLIRAQGQISADGLRAAHGLTPLAAWAAHVQGQTTYNASLGWRDGYPELSVRSPLEGLALNLPAPMGKPAALALPLVITTKVLETPAHGAQDQLQMEIGPVLSAVYVRERSGPSPRVLRGNLAVGLRTGGASALPEHGVSAVVVADALSIDDWQAVLPAPSSDATEDDSWRSYLPNRLSLQTQSLTVQGRTLHDVVAGITREGTHWHANLDARELSGLARYHQADADRAARLYARLERLDLPPSAVSEVESLLEAPPSTMPALDIEIEDLTLRGKRLGRVEIEAVNPSSDSATAGQVREWQLRKFNVHVPEATLHASGQWTAPSEQRPRRTEMDFRLDVRNAGALLTRLGTPGALRAGAGQLAGRIAWNGSPLALHYPSMQGQFQIDMARGQFLKADPGIAKLLGVLSLQGLPRRLLLDFRDVFYEGFGFDSATGQVQIAQGIASTKDLQIEGVNAVVKMRGTADIAHETQQLQVVILPQLNAGGASVVAGLAISPLFGLTSYIAQWLFWTPLSKATVQELHIDGSWTAPRVTPVVRELPPPDARHQSQP